MDQSSTEEVTPMKTRYLPAVLAVCLGSAIALPALAEDAPAAVDFGQPASAPSQPAAPAKKTRSHLRAKHHRDPLKVDPAIALKATPTKEIVLPGVMRVPGEGIGVPDPSRVQKVSWTNTGNVTVYLSADEPNRILLPFKNPYVVRTSDVAADKRAESNNVYVYWVNAPAQARHLYFEPPDGSSSLGLDIIPKNIPSQTIIVTDDTGIASGRRPKVSSGGDYTSHVQDLMEAIALGKAPDGYSQVDIKLPPIAMNGLSATVDTRYSGRDGDIYVYTVRNPTQNRVVLREEEFDGPEVIAVSIFPKPLLLPGEKTEVIVMARKREEQ
uniref:TraK protein n=2 Tax=Burkholderia pseudomallei TaxID=28450 RepID=A0A0C5BEY2_BURPE|nr:type-F conjugative transfer system secretin TraK [Burkholderia pseudomallei]AJL34963.1 sex pilus assembly protein TraK [Burkholderia pseudomallei]